MTPLLSAALLAALTAPAAPLPLARPAPAHAPPFALDEWIDARWASASADSNWRVRFNRTGSYSSVWSGASYSGHWVYSSRTRSLVIHEQGDRTRVPIHWTIFFGRAGAVGKTSEGVEVSLYSVVRGDR